MERAFLVVGLNPTIQNTYSFESLRFSQVNRVGTHRLDLAGKGANTCRVLMELGERALHLTFCGGRNGSLYRELSAAESMGLRLPDEGSEVRFCHTLLDRQTGSATEIVEPGTGVAAGLEEGVLATFRGALPEADTLIICGSKAPGFSDDLYSIMVREARDAGLSTVLDIRGDDLLGCMEYRPTTIKINVPEFVQSFLPDDAVAEETSPDDLPRGLHERMLSIREEYGSYVVLTNGSYPVIFTDGEAISSIPVAPVKVVNPIGSGDAFAAGYAAGFRRTGSVRDGVDLGIDCSRKNAGIEKPGSIR